ncbi:hypothetical protein, partial [Reichenbachiella agariperforans]|uniref:hypothetical protein n=1 Tax=Reichenbachiella agariperforans TaxID=156994 RepID=UPI001C08FA49
MNNFNLDDMLGFELEESIENLTLAQCELLRDRGISRYSASSYLMPFRVKGVEDLLLMGTYNDLGGVEVITLDGDRVLFGERDITTLQAREEELIICQDMFSFLSLVELGIYRDQSAIILHDDTMMSNVMIAIHDEYSHARITAYFDHTVSGKSNFENLKSCFKKIIDGSLIIPQKM